MFADSKPEPLCTCLYIGLHTEGVKKVNCNMLVSPNNFSIHAVLVVVEHPVLGGQGDIVTQLITSITMVITWVIRLYALLTYLLRPTDPGSPRALVRPFKFRLPFSLQNARRDLSMASEWFVCP